MTRLLNVNATDEVISVCFTSLQMIPLIIKEDIKLGYKNFIIQFGHSLPLYNKQMQTVFRFDKNLLSFLEL